MRNRYRIAASLLTLLLLVPVAALADTGYSAIFSGAQEVPPNASPATGNAVITLNNAENLLTYSVTYSGLTANRTAAHFHGPAGPGVNAGVIFGIAAGGGTSGTIAGTWAIDPTSVTYLKGGLLYINIHSTNFPGGEIRGQVLADATPNKNSTWGRIKALYKEK